ncbi:MAG: hypothetical protein Ct9H90mP15_05930 [Candidatus Neomarinimicrobiota bacterium]|nr:MAG: hypothetical protein Ct9H90mP15_05930 [Candidatus Neomarinimicrobiota bacterium]
MSNENTNKIPSFKPGDTLSINVNVKKGEKKSVNSFLKEQLLQEKARE